MTGTHSSRSPVLPAHVQESLAGLLGLLARERLLLATALAGFALAALAAIVLLVRGNTIGAEGDVQKAMSFDFAIAAYILTLAVLLPLARFTPKGRARWVAAYVLLLGYGLAVENIQVYRGIDPRFTEVGSTLDQALGGLFGAVAIGFIVMFVVLAMRWTRSRADEREYALVIGARYAAAATALAFLAGIAMSVARGSSLDGEGNLLPVHALGFHALQAMPLVAWLLATGTVEGAPARLRLHVAGSAWLVACAAVGVQAAVGRAPLAPSPANVTALVALAVWAIIAAPLLVRWWRGGHADLVAIG